MDDCSAIFLIIGAFVLLFGGGFWYLMYRDFK